MHAKLTNLLYKKGHYFLDTQYKTVVSSLIPKHAKLFSDFDHCKMDMFNKFKETFSSSVTNTIQENTGNSTIKH